jgi:hypothetical protein
MGCPSQVFIGKNLTFSICTHSADTGNQTDADTTPVFYIYEESNGTAVLSSEMQKLNDASTTGLYSRTISITDAKGFHDHKVYTIHLTADVATATGGITFEFLVLSDDWGSGGRLEAILSTLSDDWTTSGRLEAILSTLSDDWATAGRLEAILSALSDDWATSGRLEAILSTLSDDWADAGRLDAILDELTVQGDHNQTKIDGLSGDIGNIAAEHVDIYGKVMKLTDDIGDAMRAEPLTDAETLETFGGMIHAIYCAQMQRQTVTSANRVIYKLDDASVLRTELLSDDATTVVRLGG